MGEHTPPNPGPAPGAAQIARVAEEVARRRAAGGGLTDAEVLAAHADLLPELADRLRDMALVSAAGAKVRAGPTQSTGETVTLSRVGPAGKRAAETDIPRQIGPVRLLREIGRGGMGVVWLGRHQVLDRDVAVKFLLQAVLDTGGPGFRDLLAEARAAGAVRHAGLVAVHDAAVLNTVPYLVMDYVDGVALADVLRAAGPLSSAAALVVLDAVGDAVAALHDAGLVHRDLKPRNVLLDWAGRPYVGDFGLACACPPAKRAQLLTAGGTPPYMAPEMFAGEASPRSDVYALGVMLYELLTGVQPFRGATLAEIRAKHQDDPLPLEPLVQHGVAPAVIEVLERATHKNALYRTKTARHFVQALHAAVPDKAVWSRGAREWEQIVGRCDRETVRQTSSEPSTPTPSTYAELLASKAALKRERKVRSADTPAAAPVAARSEPASEAEGLADEALCVSCGYNLRGLQEEGQCPECGTLVAQSMHGDRLAAADPAWLKGICRGQAYIAIGAALILTCLSVGLLFGFGVLSSHAWNALGVGSELTFLLSLMLVLVGVVRVTALDPRLSLARQPLNLRRLSRGAAAASLLCITADAGVASILFAAYGWGGVNVAGWWAGLIVLVHVAVAGAPVILITLYLARLAERVPNQELAQRTRSTARRTTTWFAGMVVVLGALVAVPSAWVGLLFLALLAGLLWCAISLVGLWFDYRKIFKHCLLASRQLAAAAPLVDAVVARNDPATAEEGRIDEPLCVKCGYNLRGLAAEGRCPECGTPVARSVHGDRLAAADPAWLERICRGQLYIALGAALGLAGSIIVLMMLRFASTGGIAGLSSRVSNNADAILSILVYVGVVMLTTLDPRLSLACQPLGLRRLSRGAALAALVCIALRLGVQLLRSGAYPVVRASSEWADRVIELATVILVTLYLARLAERIPDPQLVQRTKRVVRRLVVCILGAVVFIAALLAFRYVIPLRMYAWPNWLDWIVTLGVALQTAFALGIIVYFVSLVRLWFAYRKVLKRCLLEARRLAAT